MWMKKKIWAFFCVCCLLIILMPSAHTAVAQAAEGLPEGTPEGVDISLYATAAVLMDADSGRVLYGKNADTVLAMASTTKIMTCILVLENASLDDLVTVSAYAASMPKVKLYIQKGEQYTVQDLLFSLMLESHNDTAVALAEHMGKQYLPKELAHKDTAEYTAEESKQAMAAFAAMMNRKAAELGCEDTWFITPNGLDATEAFILADGTTIQREHSTTAAELARIMAYCIKESPCRDAFLEITRTESHSFYANERSFTCTNHNAFLGMMDGALSGKTGFTNKAGYCYVGALKRDGRTFVVALLACGWPNNKSYKWSDTRKLMQYGIDHYFYRSFSEEGVLFDESLLKAIPVWDGQTERLGQTAYTELEIAGRESLGDNVLGDNDPEAVSDGAGVRWVEGLLLREDEEIRVEYNLEDTLTAPVERGMAVGNIDYIVGDVVYKRETIVTATDVGRIDMRWCMEQILKKYFGVF